MSWIIPICSALLLWGANWAMIKLAQYPINFIGIPPWLGWQGIIPRRAESVATRIAHSLTSRLASVEEVFNVMGPERIADHVIHSVRPQLAELVEDTVLECKPRLWDAIDESCKRDIIVRMQMNLPDAVRMVIHRITGNIDHFANLDLLTRRLLIERPALLVSLISQITSKELRFMVNAGLYFGALLGVLQMTLWQYLPYWWLLPATGFIAGILINWLVITLIFNPVNPIQIGRFRLHGLFLRRQEEVALISCRIFARDVISIQHLMDAVLTGDHGDEARALIREAFRPVVHNALESRQKLILDVISQEEFDVLDNLLIDRLTAISRVTFDDPVFNHERQVATEQTFLDRILELTSEEFEDLLRPGVKEEEILLILGGGLAAAMSGLLVYGLLTLLS